MPIDHRSLTQQADRYIEGWQQRQAENDSESYSFSSLAIGSEFTLPGGLMRQTKISNNQARAGSHIVRYYGWEHVIPVIETKLI